MSHLKGFEGVSDCHIVARSMKSINKLSTVLVTADNIQTTLSNVQATLY